MAEARDLGSRCDCSVVFGSVFAGQLAVYSCESPLGLCNGETDGGLWISIKVLHGSEVLLDGDLSLYYLYIGYYLCVCVCVWCWGALTKLAKLLSKHSSRKLFLIRSSAMGQNVTKHKIVEFICSPINVSIGANRFDEFSESVALSD